MTVNKMKSNANIVDGKHADPTDRRCKKKKSKKLANLSFHLATDNYATPQCPLTSILLLLQYKSTVSFLLRLIREHF